MYTVNVADLKAHLSRFLRRVQAGETIQVVSHRHPVARLIPSVGDQGTPIHPPIDPALDWHSVGPVDLSGHPDGLSVLLADRARR